MNMSHSFLKTLYWGMAIAVLATASSAAAAVKAHVALSHPVVLANSPQTIYALIRFEADTELPKRDGERPPLALSLVIDRSGSMEEKGKLVYAKNAAKQIVDQLAERDSLSVVEYDNVISVAWPQGALTRPDEIKQVIDALSPRGGTNLAGGMVEGIKQLSGAELPGAVKRVVLLSDGLANQGVVNPAKISAIAASAGKKSISVSTMGLGLNYDEDLMQAIAEQGRGRYYYIENPAQIATIFQQEMDVLFNLVTRGVEFSFSLGAGVKNFKVFGYPARVENGMAHVKLDDFYAGEKRALLLQLELGPLSSAESVLGQMRFSYFDLIGDKQADVAESVAVIVSKDKEVVAASENFDVSVEALLITADQEHENYVRQYERGDVLAARQNMDTLTKQLDSLNHKYQDVQLTKKVEALRMEAADIERAEQDKAYRQNYLKKNKQAFYQSKKGDRGKYLLMEGVANPDVLRLQKALADQGFYKGAMNGEYTPDLTDAVRKFQRSKQLNADGVAGPQTLRALGLY